MMVLLPDMFYVKTVYKNRFLLERVESANLKWAGEYEWKNYPSFLKYRTCDYSGESFNDEDIIYCVYVEKLKQEFAGFVG